MSLFFGGCPAPTDETPAIQEPAGENAAAGGPVMLNNSVYAPDFTLKDLAGNSATLSSFRGKANVIVHFGRTDCPGCVMQVGDLKALDANYDDSELVILSIHIMEPVNVVSAFSEREGASYRTLLDAEGSAARAYNVQMIPLNVLVDKKGALAALPSGQLPLSTIKTLVGR
jgi:peroxiredoxin